MILLAFSFISPGFAVAGALLAAVPILIHILNRRRFRTVEWAAMDFLLLAMQKNRKRLRFEHWLLLLTRCLVVALLGFALARPLSCSSTSLAGIGEKSGMHVFVLDDSFSMAYRERSGDGATHLDRAKKLAEQLMDRFSAGGQSVAVITMGRPAAAVLAKPSYDLQQARSAIGRVEQGYSDTDLAEALRLAIDIGHENSTEGNRHLYIFTDSTRSAWQTPRSAELKTLGPELAKLYQVNLFNLSAGSQWNQAVVDVQPSANLIMARSNFGADFLATVRGYGSSRDAALQWELDGSAMGPAATVQPGLDTRPVIQLQAAIKTGGPHVISAALGNEDRLGVDNRRRRVVNVSTQLKVLIVEGQRGVGALAGSGAFLQLALAPDSAGGNANYISPENISDLELGNKILTDYRVVILCGVGQIQPAAADQLQKFVQAGGTLMLFMGDAVTAENYNSVLLPRHLMPGALERRVSAVESHPFAFNFNPNGVLHPLLKLFANQEKTGLDTAQIYTYWQADVPNDPQIRVLNYQPNSGSSTGDAAISIHTLGSGRVVFVSTTANADWTTLPAKPAYVALVHELLTGSINPQDQWMNLTVQDRLVVPANVKFSATPMLLDPQARPIVLTSAVNADGETQYQSMPLKMPGIYILKTGIGDVPVAVNVPADESDVRTVDESAMRAALGNIEMNLSSNELPEVAETANAGNDLGWNVMIVVLAFAALECFLAMRFGHNRGNG